jgi:hypothetical protein
MRKPPVPKSKPKLTSSPYPVRFILKEEEQLLRLREISGLSMSEIIRRAMRYMLPRFLDGRVNLITLQDEHEHPVDLEKHTGNPPTDS